MYKLCGKCEINKLLSDFYVSKRSKDGRQSKCKLCSKRHNKMYSTTDAFRESLKRYHNSEAGLGSRRSAQRRYEKTTLGKATQKRYRDSSPNDPIAD